MTAIVDGSLGFTAPVGAVYNGLQTATAQASTSGTAITFSSIPSWVKRITVMLNGVSTNGTSVPQIQLGSGSVSTSGYTCISTYTGAGTGGLTYSSGFCIPSGSAVNLMYGSLVFTLLTGNTWICSGVVGVNSASTYYGMFIQGTAPTLSGALDRVVVTTQNGTDTFDAGSINILYE